MADMAGCSIYDLIARMNPEELNLRITNRLMQKGITFDPQKIAEIQEQQRQQKVEAFLARAREHWKGN